MLAGDDIRSGTMADEDSIKDIKRIKNRFVGILKNDTGSMWMEIRYLKKRK